MDKKLSKQIVFGIILSCLLTYTFSMCMKMVYSSSMVAIKDEYGVPHSIASLPITLYYILYAVIQLVLAIFMKKINMKLYMLITFGISALSYITIFFFSPIWYVCSVLAVNGLTLGASWCGCVLLFSKYLSKKQMDTALIIMGVGSAVGNTLSYGLSAFFMSLGNWRWSFLIVGAIFLAATLYLFFTVNYAEKKNYAPEEEPVTETPKKQVYTATPKEAKHMVIMAAIVVFFSCILYYAFTNWMPTILKNVFGMDNTTATLVTLIFPAVVFIGSYLSHPIGNSVKNDFLLNVLSGVILTVLSLILCFTYDLNVIVCVAVIVCLGIVLRFVNALNCSLVVLHTRDYFNSGTTSSLINSSACVAAGVSPALIAMILDLSGGNWKTGFIFLLGAAAVLTLVSTVFFLSNKKFRTLQSKK